MSDHSTRLGLPYLAAAQAQKHVTVNESLLRLDALIQLSAASASTAAQPGAPSDGDLFVLPAGKTGAAWSGMANGALAYYRDGAWEELTPRVGWRCYIADDDALSAWDGASWNRVWAQEERRFIFTPGGDGVVSAYRIDTARTQNPRTATIGVLAADVITLTTSDAGLFFGTAMAGVSYVRIWNTSKTPNQSAWIKAAPASNQLRVLDASAISGWTNGETIQIGDPTAVTPNRYIALDISPMMQAVLGRVFHQSGALCKMIASGASAANKVDVSANGATGSNQPARSFQDGSVNGQQNVVSCSVASPISSSNLLFVQETATGSGVAIAGVSILGLWT